MTQKDSIRCCLFKETLPDRLFLSHSDSFECHSIKEWLKKISLGGPETLESVKKKKSIRCCLFKETLPDRLFLSHSDSFECHSIKEWLKKILSGAVSLKRHYLIDFFWVVPISFSHWDDQTRGEWERFSNQGQSLRFFSWSPHDQWDASILSSRPIGSLHFSCNNLELNFEIHVARSFSSLFP